MNIENMTDDEKRLKILMAIGWKYEAEYDLWFLNGTEDSEHGDRGATTYLPDPLEDLNAMHDVLMAQPQEFRDSVNHALMESLRPSDAHVLDRTINATARQRADAFLLTLL